MGIRGTNQLKLIRSGSANPIDVPVTSVGRTLSYGRQERFAAFLKSINLDMLTEAGGNLLDTRSADDISTLLAKSISGKPLRQIRRLLQAMDTPKGSAGFPLGQDIFGNDWHLTAINMTSMDPVLTVRRESPAHKVIHGYLTFTATEAIHSGGPMTAVELGLIDALAREFTG